MNLNVEEEIKDYIIVNILNGKLKEGYPIHDIKYYTSLFKVNPTFVKSALLALEKDGFIKKEAENYLVAADDLKVEMTRINYTNRYINELVKKSEAIGVSLDQVIEVLKLRNLANG